MGFFCIGKREANWEKVHCSNWSSVFTFLSELLEAARWLLQPWFRCFLDEIWREVGLRMMAEASDLHLIAAKRNQGQNEQMCIAVFISESSSTPLPAKARGVSEGAATLYPECEPKLPLCLNHLDRSLCLGVVFSMCLGRGAQRSCFPLLPSNPHRGSRSSNLLWVYRQRELVAQASS